MIIEFDENKRQMNLKKHNIDFAKLSTVFENPIISKVDNRVDYGETRMIALGNLDDTVIVFVYTERADIIRLVSARRATKNEAKAYYRRIYG